MRDDAKRMSHKKCYATFRDFSTAMLAFPHDKVPGNWREYSDQVTNNF